MDKKNEILVYFGHKKNILSDKRWIGSKKQCDEIEKKENPKKHKKFKKKKTKRQKKWKSKKLAD
jgi:hypothetical protein